MRRAYRPGEYERGGNTKTHGIVRAEFIVHDGIPEHMRRGVFATAAHVPGLGPLLRPRPRPAARYRRCRFRELLHQADGRRRAEADGGREGDAGPHHGQHAHVRHAGHRVERAAAGARPARHADPVFLDHRPAAHPRLLHAGPVERDPDQPARSALLELRALSARRGAGDDVFGAAAHDQAKPDSRACRSTPRRSICARRWRSSSPKATSSSTS